MTNPTLGSINSCVLTQPRASLPAPKVNATSRVPTDSLLTTSTAPAFYPLLCLLELPFGFIPLMVPGGLVKSSNPPTFSDATSYGSSTTQALPRSTSQNPPIVRRSTPPVALGASKHTAATTRFKVSYMVNVFATFVAPATQQPPASADLADFVAPTAQQPPASADPVMFLSPPLPSSPPLQPTSRLLSPPLPSSHCLRPTSRFLPSPLRRSSRLRPTPRLLSSPLRRSP